MNFDVIIIGGGLAGLTCGITLQQQGKRCVIINNGQAAIDFSSGSMDLLGRLTSGKIVQEFCKSYASLKRSLPEHPYSLLGKKKVLEKAQQFEQLARALDLALIGSAEKNHLRVTPLGGLRPSWLSPNSVPTLEQDATFAYDSVAILGIEGFHDFQPQLLADNLKRQAPFAACTLTTGYLNIPQLDQLRNNAREFRSVNIAQLLEHKLAFRELVNEIQQAAQGAQAVFLPACFGLDDQRFFNQLKEAVGIALFELPTLPPSLLGIRQHKQLRQRFEQLGGFMLNGDRAIKADIEQHKVMRVYTNLYPDDAVSAEHVVLATGSYFSNGLIADFDEIYEPIFRADIIGCKTFGKSDRLSWTQSRFSQSQPYQSAGVAINDKCQVRKDGRFIDNLYAIGNVIGGFDSLALGCASGVAVVTALSVAEYILQSEQEGK
ncbi:glycerol-3-phosphate dehydrogenase subunit GlpB [Glaesserella sp.]|uniref:glycerol-3-phosphate dehydrogenase subunit GlpB n=1 Tax=Glaesserella sp. TaxID=2094731 RepID=UPI0035A01EDD